LQDRHGLSYLFITHDLAVVSELADRVAVMHSGRIVETGKTRQVLFNPENDYTRRLLAALPKLHKSARTNF
jgi:ABC-type oligopeptide transport system ATPase subunit